MYLDSLSQPALNAEASGGSRLFILAAAFLNLVGIGIVGPILPYITAQYVAPDQLAAASGLLFGSFSFFQFFAVPGLGALSDRYGRRPVLLISLAGSALGYLLFGMGGALWVLFLGRSIDGVTGGNLSTIYAYAADVTTAGERTRFFGRIGAASSLGFVVGPALGGLLARISLAAPMYFAAA
ncbi:MAG: MFS transporter, partial [Anaerolineae bacterium]|nr:MFS transporter [Anaerolineae bacterium]